MGHCPAVLRSDSSTAPGKHTEERWRTHVSSQTTAARSLPDKERYTFDRDPSDHREVGCPYGRRRERRPGKGTGQTAPKTTNFVPHPLVGRKYHSKLAQRLAFTNVSLFSHERDADEHVCRYGTKPARARSGAQGTVCVWGGPPNARSNVPPTKPSAAAM